MSVNGEPYGQIQVQACPLNVFFFGVGGGGGTGQTSVRKASPCHAQENVIVVSFDGDSFCEGCQDFFQVVPNVWLTNYMPRSPVLARHRANDSIKPNLTIIILLSPLDFPRLKCYVGHPFEIWIYPFFLITFEIKRQKILIIDNDGVGPTGELVEIIL